MKRLSDIGEDALIERLVALVPHRLPAAGGPGDDCAVIDPGDDALPFQLLKTDALVEGIHYLREAEPTAVGWKAIARVVSDFAAMGGEPEHFLVTLALPAETPVEWVEGLYRGMGECLENFDAHLAGGETCGVPAGSAAVISIAATGRVERDRLTLRSTGAAGDSLFVTGTLGGSLAGKHLDFTPRLEAARWLTRHFKPTAMMDLSDGLGKDLPRLAAASRCGYRIAIPSLPLTPGCTPQQAIGDGEDFELLFAIPSEKAGTLPNSWRHAFPDLPLTLIGRLAAESEKTPLIGGWDHFPNSLAESRLRD